MSGFVPRNHKRYNRKSYRTTKPSEGRRRGGYRKYFHEQPSQKIVYVEEPDSEADEESDESSSSSSEEEEEVYQFGLQDNSDVSDDDEISGDYPEGEYVIELDDDDLLDILEENGDLEDLNDQLVRYYDESSSEEESESSDEEVVDILDVIDLNDQLQAEALHQMIQDGTVAVDYSDSQIDSDDSDLSTDSENSESELSSGSESSSDSSDSSESEESESENDCECDYCTVLSEDESSDSDSDSSIDYSSDEEELNKQLQLENVRQKFAEDLVSEDELSVSSSSDSESVSDSEVEFIEIDSDINMDDESDVDAGDPKYYEYEDSSDSSDSSDDEGVTIYKHRFDLPESYESENDSTDDELLQSDEEDSQVLLADDSDNEVEVIDLRRDLENSKDCELVELDNKTYKLTVRFPSIVKEDLKIDFLKKNNELVISGRFDFDDELESSDDDESSDEEFSTDSDDYSYREDSYESAGSDDEEVVNEDTDLLIRDFKDQEIMFEKHFQFEKDIKFNHIEASFNKNGELVMIIPNKNKKFNRKSNTIPVNVVSDDETSTEEFEFSP